MAWTASEAVQILARSAASELSVYVNARVGKGNVIREAISGGQNHGFLWASLIKGNEKEGAHYGRIVL